MLTALPSPGTPQFAKLAASLQPYGIVPRGITFEAPSSRMSDVSLNFLLLRGELRIKVTYDGFEIVAGELLDEHIPMAAALVSIAHEAIRDSSGDSAAGRHEITYSAHLSLAPGEVVRILHEHLTRLQDKAFVPDAFAYRLAPSDRSDVIGMRLAVANRSGSRKACMRNSRRPIGVMCFRSN